MRKMWRSAAPSSGRRRPGKAGRISSRHGRGNGFDKRQMLRRAGLVMDRGLARVGGAVGRKRLVMPLPAVERVAQQGQRDNLVGRQQIIPRRQRLQMADGLVGPRFGDMVACQRYSGRRVIGGNRQRALGRGARVTRPTKLGKHGGHAGVARR